MVAVSSIREAFDKAISDVRSGADLEAVQLQFLGRKQGQLSAHLREIGRIGDKTRQKAAGQAANVLKDYMLATITARKNELDQEQPGVPSGFDVTLPGKLPTVGHIHPLRQVQQELIEIFYSMGFMVLEGNELETEDYCFEYLNIPPSHPARDLQDTFFIDDDTRPQHNQWVLRTHTSNMQVRTMQQYTPPLRAVVPGRAFRNEATDASHEHTFYQMEGFVVDTDISIANLTYCLKMAMSKVLKHAVHIRLRPGYFPYVEPGFEADCSCVQCDGKGCAVCKYTGWVEMLGCGMIHPKVFESAGYPAGKYTGFAFGMGISRLAMMKYAITDNRLFMAGDLRFNCQF